jgi:hypothetical protein
MVFFVEQEVLYSAKFIITIKIKHLYATSMQRQAAPYKMSTHCPKEHSLSRKLIPLLKGLSGITAI